MFEAERERLRSSSGCVVDELVVCPKLLALSQERVWALNKATNPPQTADLKVLLITRILSIRAK